MLTRSGPDVDHPVGRVDGVLVVLDDDQGVADVAEPDEGLQEPVVVPLVQADGRLVQDVQHPDQTGADLGGQPDPLRLAARQGGRGPVQGQVVQAHVEQEPQPGVDLLEHPLRDVRVAVVELQAEQELGALADRHGRDVRDGPVADGHREDDRLEPPALAGRARDLPHVALEPLPGGVALRLGVPPLDPRDHALVGGVVGALPPVPVLVGDVHLLVVPVHDGFAGLRREPLERGVEVEAHRVAEAAEQPQEVLADVPVGPGVDRPVVEGLLLVGNDQLRIHLHPGAEPGAVGTRAVR